MSVQSEIDRINQNVANTYSVLEEAGADIPSEQNTNNLPETAASIKAVLYGKEQTLTEEEQALARANIGITELGGSQSDWNAAEDEPGHVLNRPFYSYTETTVATTLLANGTYTSEPQADVGGVFAAIVETDSSVVMNNPLFNVVFDDVEYRNLELFESGLGTLLGNGALLAPLFEAYGVPTPEDTGEPFVFSASTDETWTDVALITDITQSTTHELSLVYVSETSEEVTVKLSKKYYDAAGASYGIAGGEIFNDYSNNIAPGSYSHAEGHFTEAVGITSHAEGTDSKAYGKYSHAEGYASHAQGDHSHAEGDRTVAYGVTSHAEGTVSKAYGNYSHTEGFGTITEGYYSHAEGLYTEAHGTSQHVQGEYNIIDTTPSSQDTRGKYAHIVGNGTTIGTRSNAHTLDWDGNAWFQGEVYVGGTGQDDTAAVKLLKTSDLPTAINTALAQAKESGEFNGADGEDGQNGVSATHSWSGTTLTITSASGTSSANLKGDKGDKGDNGTTPVRGTDYWTEADKAEIKSYVDNAILGGAW